MTDEPNTHDDEEVNNDTSTDMPEPSNAWIWIILFLLFLIILFFALGGNSLFVGGGNTIT